MVAWTCRRPRLRLAASQPNAIARPTPPAGSSPAARLLLAALERLRGLTTHDTHHPPANHPLRAPPCLFSPSPSAPSLSP